MATRLPAPEQLMIVPLNEMELAELIERHIDFVDKFGRSVHLPSSFVRHYMKRNDGGLPIATSVAQTPIVLNDGTVLAGPGLDRRCGIVFRITDELMELLPIREECTAAAVGKAMRFLADEWLCDAACTYADKCILIACALTVLERALLPQRPAFFVTAGQRGGGKTTTIHMISMATLGLPASAAAWSPVEEERRKALFAYLGAGLPMLVWDNLARGTVISCPSIEKALTTEFYSDRVLGVSEIKTVPAYTVQVFTGNNIAPRGDLASRSLIVRLAVDRPDPENREFQRPDPIEWTDANRGRILASFYTLLLGNPRRRQKKGSLQAAPTRFKEWWDMVGSAVEYAADQHKRILDEEFYHFVNDSDQACQPAAVSFKSKFLDSEADEEQTSALTTVIETLHHKYQDDNFQASEVATYAGKAEDYAIAFKDALERAAGKPIKIISSTTVSWRLKALVGAPVKLGSKILVLKYNAEHQGGNFRVETVDDAA
jgi:hypothetical protein